LALGPVLEHDAFAVLPGLRQVSKTRVGETVAPLEPELIQSLDRALFAYLSD
jgi:hypothetical protein